MTDAPMQTQPTQPQAQAMSPLDVLDQILNDTKSKAEKEKADLEQQQKDLAEKVKFEQFQKDQQKIAEELTALEREKQSPQYQAAVQQKEDEEASRETRAAQLDGMEIVQLSHKTI